MHPGQGIHRGQQRGIILERLKDFNPDAKARMEANARKIMALLESQGQNSGRDCPVCALYWP